MGNKEIEYPRLLVIANNSFSLVNSNGRTLGSLLEGWPIDRIAQFCISSDGADFNVCDNYYCVTDADVRDSIIKLKRANRRNLKNTLPVNANRENGHVRFFKTPLNMLARNFAWMTGLWKTKEFEQWLSDFNPDIVMLQSGESFFMHQLSCQIARRYNAKLAIFNTEGFYLFEHDYFFSTGKINKILFKVYRKVYNYYFRRFMNICDGQIYGNELLREDYGRIFGNKHNCTIYTSSKIQFKPKPLPTIPTFLYAGNMGFDRPKALIEFAEIIAEINPLFKLDVYGYTKSKAMEDLLNSCPAIRFHGAVPYSDIVKVTSESDFLVHVESQDEKYQEGLRYGFSTKIADSICSGKLFILYASSEIACSRYIINTGAGIFASTREDLKTAITNILDNPKIAITTREKAKYIADINHNLKRNNLRMYEFLKTI